MSKVGDNDGNKKRAYRKWGHEDNLFFESIIEKLGGSVEDLKPKEVFDRIKHLGFSYEQVKTRLQIEKNKKNLESLSSSSQIGEDEPPKKMMIKDASYDYDACPRRITCQAIDLTLIKALRDIIRTEYPASQQAHHPAPPHAYVQPSSEDINPKILATFPPDIQAEVLAQQEARKVTRQAVDLTLIKSLKEFILAEYSPSQQAEPAPPQAYVQPSSGDINPKILATFPPDIQAEVLAQQEARKVTRQAVDLTLIKSLREFILAEYSPSQQAEPAPPQAYVQPSSGDINPKILATFPPDIQAEVLAQQEARKVTRQAVDLTLIKSLRDFIRAEYSPSQQADPAPPQAYVQPSSEDINPKVHSPLQQADPAPQAYESFVPLVQQKQAAAVNTGKRDVKVKALNAAEAAKRLEEKKETARELKRKPLKLEKARLEEENVQQAEVKRKKKEDELKEKKPDVARRKRLRKEEDNKERERKRRRFEGKHQLRTRKLEKDLPVGVTGAKLNSETGILDASRKPQKVKVDENKGDESNVKKTNTEFMASKSLNSDVRQDILEGFGHSRVSKEGTDTSQGKSYEISPYQSSDNDDKISPNKFVPTWASKESLARMVSSQNDIDPDNLFPSDSFCSADEISGPGVYKKK